ncbi:MAG: hypothetical protein ABII88_01555 [Candidatus Omnitrophota bacterium]
MKQTNVFKIISFFLIQVFILVNLSLAFAGDVSVAQEEKEMLAPSVQIEQGSLKNAFEKRQPAVPVIAYAPKTGLLPVIPYYINVPLSFQKILEKLFGNPSNWDMIRQTVAPNSKSFLPMHIQWLDEGALKRVVRVRVITDHGQISLGFRFYYTSTENTPAQAEGKAREEKIVLNHFYGIDKSAIEIFDYISDVRLDGDMHQLLSQNDLVGFTVGEFIDGPVLEKVGNALELSDMLKESIATITNVWLHSVKREHRGKYRGFAIKDMKLANFVYDQNLKIVRFIDVDMKERITFTVLLENIYDYVCKSLKQKNIPITEQTLSYILSGVQQGVQRFSEYNLPHNPNRVDLETVSVIVGKYVDSATQGVNKVKDIQDSRWMRLRVLAQAATGVLVGLSGNAVEVPIIKQAGTRQNNPGDFLNILVNSSI